MRNAKWIYRALLIHLSILIFQLSLFIAPASARSGSGGASSAEFLRLGTGARAPARGDAATATAEGVMALHYNPAGLGFVRRGEVEGMYQKAVLDIGQGSLGFAHPLGRSGGWGVGVNYLDYGSTNRTTVTTVGGVTTVNDAGTFKGHDLAVGVSYGRHIADWSLGGTVKGISSSYDGVGATAVAVDLGVMWRSASHPIALGLTVQNLGTRMKFDRTSERLPLLGRVGAAWSPIERLTLTVDVEKARQERVNFMGGVEWWVVKMLALRGGYDSRNDLGKGWTAGAGFRHNDFSVDYAFKPFGKTGNNHRFALNYRFGAER